MSDKKKRKKPVIADGLREYFGRFGIIENVV
jgi:hypothetical protein